MAPTVQIRSEPPRPRPKIVEQLALLATHEAQIAEEHVQPQIVEEEVQPRIVEEEPQPQIVEEEEAQPQIVEEEPQPQIIEEEPGLAEQESRVAERQSGLPSVLDQATGIF